MSDYKRTIDVVITTSQNYNKNYSLYFTLRSILSQTLLPNKIFVIENDNSTKMKRMLDSDFGNFINFIDASSNVENISYCRNLGASISCSDLILFMDDDVVIGDSDAIEKIVDRMRFLDFYCGALRFWSQINWYNQLKKTYSINHVNNILKSTSILPKSIDRTTGTFNYHNYTFIGNFGCVRKDVFLEVNGFDENFKGWSYQDTDLMMRLTYARKEYQLMADKGLKVYHLSHPVNKKATRESNLILYEKKQKEIGIKFHLNHFFADFNDDKYALFSHL
ncbi:glycosyltransferase [Kordia sp. TARA_039_SRF]|nr:glycosyltransferase [Kordia sp. TARA_039_SRF]